MEYEDLRKDIDDITHVLHRIVELLEEQASHNIEILAGPTRR